MNYLKEYIKEKIIGTQYEGRGYIDNVMRMFDDKLVDIGISNILDIGCSDGYKTNLFAQYFNIPSSYIYGLDFDSQTLSKCKNLFNIVLNNLEQGFIPFKDSIFDLIICNQVLEHLVSYQKILSELVRITSPEGYIIIGIPNLSHLINRIYLLFGYQPLSISTKGPHIRGFTHREFIKVLENVTGIRLLHVTGEIMYPLPKPVAKILCKYFAGLSGYTCYLLQKKV